jgi:predicted ATPase/class 3 adenylate cyclase
LARGGNRAKLDRTLPELPTGTVTLVFTDIEGSTRLLRELGERYADALAEHRRVLREAFGHHGGFEVDTQGDAFFFAFTSAREAVGAASEAQKALAEGLIRVRIGVHTGEPALTEEGYIGSDVHRAARICAAGHGGQIVVSDATRALLDGSELRDLGEHRLKDLSEPRRLYQLGEDEFPPLRTLYQTNLPVPSTPFLGRERELSEVLGLLRSGRMLTLTGPGGTGKTRLAAQAAAESAEDFPGGVWWVSLAAVPDPELVLDSIAQVLGAKGELAEHIADKELLLLLDNLEQLLSAAPKLAELLARCGGLRLLVTSREPLRVAAEQEYPVPPLVSEEAVGFFCARARVVRPDFEPSADVAAICRRLDNLPLALELAAARVKVLSLEQILARLEHALPLLTGGRRDAPERQHTLAATIAWSYDLLNEDERILFSRVSVFAGGCTLEAAEQVCKADVERIASLVDKSLLRHTQERFWMLATIREYALERLDERGETPDLRRRHADHLAALARRAGEELRGPDAARCLTVLEQELDNVRTAIAFALETGDIELGLALTTDLYRFWLAHGRASEGRRWLDELLARADTAEPGVVGAALHRAGDMALWQGDHERAAELSRRAVPLLREAGLTEKLCYTLTTHGWAVGALGDQEQAVAVLEDALALARAEGFEMPAASALNNLAAVHKLRSDYVRALELNEECLEIIQRAGDPLNVAVVLGNVGETALGVGDHRRASEVLERSLALARELGDSRQAEWSLAHLALASLLEGDTERSEKLFAESLPQAFEVRDQRALEVCLHGLAGVVAAGGDSERAARLWGAAERVRESLGSQPSPPQLAVDERYLAGARETLGDRFGPLEKSGRELSVEDAVALATRAQVSREAVPDDLGPVRHQ